METSSAVESTSAAAEPLAQCLLIDRFRGQPFTQRARMVDLLNGEIRVRRVPDCSERLLLATVCLEVHTIARPAQDEQSRHWKSPHIRPDRGQPGVREENEI